MYASQRVFPDNRVLVPCAHALRQPRGFHLSYLMVADTLTKSLPSPAHIKHRDIMLGHVPFSFAARTLRNFIGGGGLMIPLSLFLSPPAVTVRAFPVVTGGVFSNMRNIKGAPYIFEG